MEKVRILMLGAAFSADLHMDGYRRFADKARVTAICDKEPDRIRALAERYGITDYRMYTDYRDAIENAGYDMADICLPNFLHCDPALLALEKGKNVICEKPLATTVEDAVRMVEKAAGKGRHIYYAEDWICAPAIKRALSITGEGAVGDVVYIRARECHSGSHSPFAKKIEFCGGGSAVHLGIHPVGLLLSVKNNEWAEITAATSGGLNGNLVHKDIEGEDLSVAVIKFKDGTFAEIESNYVTCGGMEDMIDFYGTKGCLHVDLNFSGAVSCFSIPGVSYAVEKAEITAGWTKPAVDEKYNLGYVSEIEHFLDMCMAGLPAAGGLRGEDGLEALKVVQYMYQSAREGRKIVNPEL